MFLFRLIKLALYAFVGYALYELLQGMMTPPQQRMGGSGRQRGRGGAQQFEGAQADEGATPHGQVVTGGAGSGRAEQTLDNDGGSVRHNVGRGVVM